MGPCQSEAGLRAGYAVIPLPLPECRKGCAELQRIPQLPAANFLESPNSLICQLDDCAPTGDLQDSKQHDMHVVTHDHVEMETWQLAEPHVVA